jgi:hypothetical protein
LGTLTTEILPPTAGLLLRNPHRERLVPYLCLYIPYSISVGYSHHRNIATYCGAFIKKSPLGKVGTMPMFCT